MTIIENSGGVNKNDSDNNDQISKSSNESPGISDEDLLLELDNMLEEDGEKKASDFDILSTGMEINGADLDIGKSEELIDIIDDDDVFDLDESIEVEEIDLEQEKIVESGTIDSDDIIDLSDDEHIEELSDADIVSDSEYVEDELLEIEDLVSDETLQYDPLLSKSKTEELYIKEAPRPSRDVEDFDELDLISDYGSDYSEDMDLEITSDMDISEDNYPYGESSVVSGVSVEQIEAAVERVVTRLFIDRIETMLSEVIERVVREELSNLKKSLSDIHIEEQ